MSLPPRKTRCSLLFVLFLLTLLAPSRALAQDQQPAAQPATAAAESLWSRDLSAWRVAREAEVSAPDGWLTLVGIDWLKPGVNSFGSSADNVIHVRAQAPEHIGMLTLSVNPKGGAFLQLLSPNGGFPPDLMLDGKPAREGPLDMTSPKPPTMTWHGLTMAVLNRGGRFALRVKDADAPARTSFHGLNWYAPNPHLRVQALWSPFTPPRIEKIPTALGTTLDLPSPGIAQFMIGETTYRLEPVLEDPKSQTLFFILRDATGKTATYETARYLHTGLPDHGLDKPGLLTLDFNLLENPPCAYSTYATCPLPPEKNRLPAAIEAGERRYTP